MREIAGRIPENSQELVSTIIRKVTGFKTTSIEHISGKGMNNSVTIASSSRGRFVVRTNVESHLFRFEREAWCFMQLKGSPVLTPEVLGCGIEGAHSYSVAPFIEGSSPIHGGLDEIRVWRTLGEYASHLNKIRAPVPESQAGRLFPESWKGQVASDVEIIFREGFWLGKCELTQERQERLREYLRGSADINAPYGICQFDLTVANALICDSNYDQIYLIDLEWANIAPVPYYQLACIAAEKGPESEITKSFFDGYGLTKRQITEIDLQLNRFNLYRVMRATAWARDRCPNLVDENLNRSKPIIDRTFREELC